MRTKSEEKKFQSVGSLEIRSVKFDQQRQIVNGVTAKEQFIVIFPLELEIHTQIQADFSHVGTLIINGTIFHPANSQTQ